MKSIGLAIYPINFTSAKVQPSDYQESSCLADPCDLPHTLGERFMADTTITNIRCRRVFDSREVETLEGDVSTQKGFGRVAAPFGAPGSRGEFEAPAYAPGGLRESMEILGKDIIPLLIGMDALERERINTLLIQLDGTPNFEKIGGNGQGSRRYAENPDVPIIL